MIALTLLGAGVRMLDVGSPRGLNELTFHLATPTLLFGAVKAPEVRALAVFAAAARAVVVSTALSAILALLRYGQPNVPAGKLRRIEAVRTGPSQKLKRSISAGEHFVAKHDFINL